MAGNSETINYGRAFYHQGSETGEAPATWVSRLINDRSQASEPFMKAEEALLDVDPNAEFTQGDAFNKAVIKILSDETGSRRNYQEFIVALRKDPDLIVNSIKAGDVDFDTAVKHVAAIRQHYLDVHSDDAQILLEGMREFMTPPEPTTEVLQMQELISAMNANIPRSGDGAEGGGSLSFVDPLYRLEQIQIVFERIYLGLAGLDRQSQDFATRVDRLRQQTIWFISYSGLSEYFQSLVSEGNNAFEVATAVGDMISGYFKLRNAADKISHMNKGNSQELGALAAELPNSPELEALLHCFNYEMRVIDLDGNERVIRDGIRERMRYLSGEVDPQRLGYMEYVDFESRDRVVEILDSYGPDIAARYGNGFDVDATYEKWQDLLNSGMKVDVENIVKEYVEYENDDGTVDREAVGMYKDWSDAELQFVREVLVSELWSDGEHAYKTSSGRTLGQDEPIIPIFLDDASLDNLDKYGWMNYFDFGNPFVGALQPATEHFTRKLTNFNDDGVGAYFEYLMRKNGIDPNRIDAVDLPRFSNGREWRRVIVVKGRRGVLNTLEIGLLGGGGLAKAGGDGDHQAPFAYLYEYETDARGEPLLDPDTGHYVLRAQRDASGNEILMEKDGEPIPRRYMNGEIIKRPNGSIVYEPAHNKYNKPSYQPVYDENDVPVTVNARPIIIKDIMAARMSGVGKSVNALWHVLLNQDADPYDDSQILSKSWLRALNWEGYSQEFAMNIPYMDFLFHGHMSSLEDRKDQSSYLFAAIKADPNINTPPANDEEKRRQAERGVAVRLRNPDRVKDEIYLEPYQFDAGNKEEQIREFEWLTTSDRRIAGLRENDDINLNRLVAKAKLLQAQGKDEGEIVAALMNEAEGIVESDYNTWLTLEGEYGPEGRMRSQREIMAELDGRAEHYSEVFEGFSCYDTAKTLGIDVDRYPRRMWEGRLGLSTLMSHYDLYGWHNFGNIRSMFEDLLAYAGKHGDVAQEVIPGLITASVVANAYGSDAVYAQRFGSSVQHDVKSGEELVQQFFSALQTRPADKERAEQIKAISEAGGQMQVKWSHIPAAAREVEIASLMGRLNQYQFGREPNCVYVLEREGQELPMICNAYILYGGTPESEQRDFIVTYSVGKKEEMEFEKVLKTKYARFQKVPIVETGVPGDKKAPLSLDVKQPWGRAVDEVVRMTGAASTVRNARGDVKLTNRSGQMVFRIHVMDDGSPIVPRDDEGRKLMLQPLLRAYGSTAPMLASDKGGSEKVAAINNWWGWTRRALAESRAVSSQYMRVFDSYKPGAEAVRFWSHFSIVDDE